MHRRQITGNGRKFNLLHEKEEKIAKRFKTVFGRKTKFCRKQLKSQEATGKTSKKNKKKMQNEQNKKKLIRRSKKSKKSWTVPQVISWTVRPRRCQGSTNRALSAQSFL